MPRIPTYTAQGQAAIANYPRVQGLPAPSGAIGTGLGEISTGLTQAATVMQNAQRLQQQEDEKLDLARAKTDVEVGFAAAEIDVRQNLTSPDDYMEQLGARVDALVQQTTKSLKYPGSAVKFAGSIQPFLAEKEIKARYDVAALKRADLEVRTDTEIARQTNLAVTAETPELRDQAAQQALDLAWNAGVKLTYSREKTVAAMAHVRTQVETGRIESALRDPAQADLVLTQLERGQASAYLPAPLQYTLANQYTDRLDKQLRQAEADAARLETQVAKRRVEAFKTEYNDVFRRADAPQPGDAPATLADVARLQRFWGPLMSREDQHALTEAIRKPAKDQPSDPQTLDRFTADIYGVTPRANERNLRAARDAGLLSGKDYQQLLGHLTTRVESIRKEGESDLDREMNRAKTEGLTAIGIPPFLQTLTHDQQKWVAEFYSEFNRRVLPERAQDRAGQPPERPEAVIREMIPRYQAMMAADGRLQLNQLRALINPLFPTPQALEQGRQQGQLTPGAYEAQQRIWGQIGTQLRDKFKGDWSGTGWETGAPGKPGGSKAPVVPSPRPK